ncbi:MAG: hypothetical protein DMG70_16190, partial [Acidobacteria bacterium]
PTVLSRKLVGETIPELWMTDHTAHTRRSEEGNLPRVDSADTKCPPRLHGEVNRLHRDHSPGFNRKVRIVFFF